MNRFKKYLESPRAAYTIAACSAVLFYMILSRFHLVVGALGWAFNLVSPVIIGLVFAYLMNPIAGFYQTKVLGSMKKENIRQTVAVLLAVLTFLLALVLIIVAVVPSVVSNFVSLASNRNLYISMIDDFLGKMQTMSQGVGLDIDDLTKSLEGLIKEALNLVPQSIGAIWQTSLTVGSTMVNVVIGFIIAIYFLMSKQSILAAVNRLRRASMKKAVYERHTAFWKHCDEVFMQYISCNLVDGLIVGSVNAMVMLLLRMPYVALLSVLVGVTNLIPTVGPVIGAVIGAFVLVINKPIMALWFLILTIVLQTLDGYVIKPKLFGSSLGIPAALTLISIILGGKLCGILGILLAIPVVSIFLDLYNESFLPWLESRKLDEE